MLEINNLTVSVEGEIVLKNINLEIGDQQTVVLFGPNGSGKSTLFKVIMGLSKYKIKEGEIIFSGKSINSLSIDDRNKLGIAMMFQQPPAVAGVQLKDLVEQVNGSHFKSGVEKINVQSFLGKGINAGLSGGEKKRSELFQLMADESAKMYLFDEPDSGVDLENLELVGNVVNDLVESKASMIVTHTGDILNFVTADTAYVLIDGRIVCSGNPESILSQIKDQGYSDCFSCQKGDPDE